MPLLLLLLLLLLVLAAADGRPAAMDMDMRRRARVVVVVLLPVAPVDEPAESSPASSTRLGRDVPATDTRRARPLEANSDFFFFSTPVAEVRGRARLPTSRRAGRTRCAMVGGVGGKRRVLRCSPLGGLQIPCGRNNTEAQHGKGVG